MVEQHRSNRDLSFELGFYAKFVFCASAPTANVKTNKRNRPGNAITIDHNSSLTLGGTEGKQIQPQHRICQQNVHQDTKQKVSRYVSLLDSHLDLPYHINTHIHTHIKYTKPSYGPRQANLVLITYASSEGSGKPAHPRSLARTSAARSYKQ